MNYDMLGATYNCYQTLFGRDSYDNAGATLISTVHYGTNYVNAYWDGTQMVYGDGDGVDSIELGKDVDVTVHELTHAVTDTESDLIYSGESGGLNECHVRHLRRRVRELDAQLGRGRGHLHGRRGHLDAGHRERRAALHG